MSERDDAEMRMREANSDRFQAWIAMQELKHAVRTEWRRLRRRITGRDSREDCRNDLNPDIRRVTP